MPNLERRWLGNVLILPGVGVFAGRAGDNKPHRHWAHQICIGLDENVVVFAKGRIQGPAVWVPAGVLHQLQPTDVMSIYLDPTLILSKALEASGGAGVVVSTLDADWIGDIRQRFLHGDSLSGCVRRLMSIFGGHPTPDTDIRLERVLSVLSQGVRDPFEPPMDRASLARLAGVSDSRFSHWFSERTGMPFRSYRKWLRLIHGLELALAGEGLTNAAHLSGFADQAYFTRTFVELFGVSPAHLLSEVRLRTG